MRRPERPVSDLALTAVAEIRVELGEQMDSGFVRDGRRRFTPILGGSFSALGAGGPLAGLDAEILPGGGDRPLVRIDGPIEIGARYLPRTADGELIEIGARGIRRADAGGVYFRVAMRFATAAPELAALQDALYIADGVREAGAVRHTVYRVG